ncbi:hypothetical protein GCM10018965_082340 [Nonomuraea roseola]
MPSAADSGIVLANGPHVDGWRTTVDERGVFSARRDPDRSLTRAELRGGPTRHLTADSWSALVSLIEDQGRLEEAFARSLAITCPTCRQGQGDAPLIITVDESSVTAERCVESYSEPDCPHGDVEWTYQRPVVDGARCQDCDTWWRLDLIPDQVAARLNGGNPPREDIRPPADGRTRS